MGDYANLNVPVVGINLSVHGFSVTCIFSMEVLVAGGSTERNHVAHPKMIGIHSEGANSLFEGGLNFESQSVEANNL